MVNAHESTIAPAKEITNATTEAQLAGKRSDHSGNPIRGKRKIETQAIGNARSISGAVRSAIARANQKL
jgi:hypothetical protein